MAKQLLAYSADRLFRQQDQALHVNASSKRCMKRLIQHDAHLKLENRQDDQHHSSKMDIHNRYRPHRSHTFE